MKYNVVISRTYATEMVVDAENIQEVHEWLGDNDDKVNHEELEQCNIIETYTNVELVEPSPNEAEQLMALAYHIQGKLHEYRHVEDFVPQGLHKALSEMLSHNED
jgi:UPF0288 family protein (methanogenesis marker protein 3)